MPPIRVGAEDALMVVDLQVDFCPGGALAVPDGDGVVPVLNACARRFHEDGLAVLASRDWHPAETAHFVDGGGPWPPHCVQGTPGAAFHPDLVTPPGTIVLSKVSRSSWLEISRLTWRRASN